MDDDSGDDERDGLTKLQVDEEVNRDSSPTAATISGSATISFAARAFCAAAPVQSGTLSVSTPIQLIRF